MRVNNTILIASESCMPDVITTLVIANYVIDPSEGHYQLEYTHHNYLILHTRLHIIK